MAAKLLIVDDDPAAAEFLAIKLQTFGYETAWHTTAQDALDALQRGPHDALLTDLAMPETGGLELCTRAQEIDPELPVIVVTGHAELDAAVAALRAGAYDFVTKPVDTKLLERSIARAVQHRSLGREVRRLREELARTQGTGEIVGRSRSMRAVFDLMQRVASADAPVLILGESGTGKELVARGIHRASARASAPFVALNCAAIPPSLIESQLFGHVKGAFTDARQSRDGLFVQAHGGTLFLDEVAELPLELQPKLLRALQEHEVRPVGGNADVPFDARIITATNADLESAVDEGAFREDLMYRIDVVRIELPPLRERGRDVLLLAEHFLQKYAEADGTRHTLSEDAAALLLAYDWRGNVRELENCMQRAVALARHPQIAVADLPAKIREHRSDRVMLSFDGTDELLTLEQLEARYIRKVLDMVDGNKSKAARILGMDRRSLYRRLEKSGDHHARPRKSRGA